MVDKSIPPIGDSGILSLVGGFSIHMKNLAQLS